MDSGFRRNDVGEVMTGEAGMTRVGADLSFLGVAAMVP